MSSIYFQTMGMAIILLLLFIYFSKERIINRETEIYSKLLIVTFFALLFDISIILITYFCALSQVLNILWVLNKFYLSSLLIYVTLFAEYIDYISKDTKVKEKKDLDLFNKVCLVIDFLAIILIFLLPIEIYSENGAMYSYGASINFLVVVASFYVINMAYNILKSHKNIISKKYTPLYILILLVFLTIIIRNLDPSILITTAIAAYVDLIMYFTIENPDKKMIEALNEAKLAAEKANRAKSDFLSNMSHEIRTPLNAIVGFSDCILEEENIESAKNDARDIKMASENLLEIVNGVLDISKIEANKMEIISTQYEPLTIFSNTINLVSTRIGEKPLEIITNYDSTLPYQLYGDAGKIKQIITNLLTNAIKYTEKGEIVFKVTCQNENDSSKLTISVEDTGRGIKENQLDRLFNKFERLEEDRNSALEGTGLGLAITKRLIEMMGGNIMVESKYGKGSKFTVYIEQIIIKQDRPEQTSLPKEIDDNVKVEFPNKRVLLVDDNKINLKVAEKLLNNLKITTVSVASGFECLELIQKGEKYDLIFLDDMMPKMSGVETLKKLKETADFAIPVVALTANAVSGMKEKYLTDGFNEYLPKPIDREELLTILNKFLDK